MTDLPQRHEEPCQHIWNAHRQCQWCHRDRKDIDYEDSIRDARDLLLLVSPDATPMESLSGIISQLNHYIAGLQAERDELIDGIRYWSYCTSEGMRETAPEKCDELAGFLMKCKIAPYYMQADIAMDPLSYAAGVGLVRRKE